MYIREHYHRLIQRFGEKRRFIQVLTGPRQTGKTTIALQLQKQLDIPVHFSAADEPFNKGAGWIGQQWETARIKSTKSRRGALLIIDEIQKINGWEETVKKYWDEDSRNGTRLYLLLLGSSAMLIHKGLGESLAGRFERIAVTHWSYKEMKKAFNFSLNDYLYYGGYPGSAQLISDSNRWKQYIQEALIESTLSKDILQMTRIDKPALLRSLFYLGCAYSGRVLSLVKVIGQLQDAGNTTTLSHYLELLKEAGLLTGLQKYAGQKARQRASSPKFQVLNNALMSVQSGLSVTGAVNDKEYMGRLTESAVGTHLTNAGSGLEVFYWASGNSELDFVIAGGGKTAAIEVKSGRVREKKPGLEQFVSEFPGCKKYLIGKGGIPLEEFLQLNPEELLK